jgi:uncharacterized membrane protein YphA (DoxX/SURF4 family)
MKDNISKYGPLVLRIGLALVFLWFGADQLAHTAMWVGVVPKWATGIFGNASTVIYLNAWFEIVSSILLVIGFQTRWVALLLALHLADIASGFGLSSTGVRDWGLAIATLSVSLSGYDVWCLDRKFAKVAEWSPSTS